MAAVKPAKKKWIDSALAWLCDGYWPHRGKSDGPARGLCGRQRTYILQQFLARGDVADVYFGTGEDACGTVAEDQYIFKRLRVRAGLNLLDVEWKTLRRLRATAGATTYSRYLPRLVETFFTGEPSIKRVNVFVAEPGFRTLEQAHEQHAALDGRHLGWIFKRLLTVLGFSHRQGVIHGAILPCHVLIDAASHGMQLIGWGQNVARSRTIKNIPTRYTNWYPLEVMKKQPAEPATDLFLAARCLVYLAGGDPATNWMPAAVPRPMRQFIATCLFESAQMRPHDAWALQEEFDELLGRLYGPPKFHGLILT